MITALLAIASAVNTVQYVDRLGDRRVAQVEEYIENANCKENYIRFSKPTCVKDGECYEFDSAEDCEQMHLWQWPKHYPGTNPHPSQRITAKGNDTQKVVWAYSGSITQAEAMQVYDPSGQVTTNGLLDTAVNQVSFIANILIDEPSKWFRPGHNNTNGCGQMQTWELPFGYNGNATTSLPKFKSNLKKLHEAGKTITLTMGSWCTQFPVKPEEEWDASNFTKFVDYFEEIKQSVFGGYLDGIDFDWEGYCSFECLKGANACHCLWDDDKCGSKSPEELANGVVWHDGNTKYECWRMATKSTVQIMAGITYHMKNRGHVVTLVPMSTQVYTSDEDKTPNQVMRNELVKYRMQPYKGGRDFGVSDGKQVDLLDMVDGILLQWYSGFDATLCKNSKDPKACACDNIELEDYPNTIHADDNTMISAYWSVNGSDGNYFPRSYPVRCKACSGKKGDKNACAPEEDMWFKVCNESHQSCTNEHNVKLANYTVHHNGSQYWWPEGIGVDSKCPRAVDCPDWRYKDEVPYSRQMNMIRSLSKVMDLNKLAIGFETLGTDVLVQMQAFQDSAEPWSAITQGQKQRHIYYAPCKANLTANNSDMKQRCAQPLLVSQWGLKFNASEVRGLDAAIQKEFGKSLFGVGFFTLDGVIKVPSNETKRLWADELDILNRTWAHIPGGGVPVTSRGICKHNTPSNQCMACEDASECGSTDPEDCTREKDPSCKIKPIGRCTHTSTKNACGPCDIPQDCGSADWSVCWASADPACPPAPSPSPSPPSQGGFCTHDAPKNSCNHCGNPSDCGGSDWSVCTMTKDKQCGAKAKGSCTHDSPKNACGPCNSPPDCGGSDWSVCWAVKDSQCPQEELLLM